MSIFDWLLKTGFTVTLSINNFRNTISVSNRLDLDQARQNVGPDLGPNCLQMLSADNKTTTSRESVKKFTLYDLQDNFLKFDLIL